MENKLIVVLKEILNTPLLRNLLFLSLLLVLAYPVYNQYYIIPSFSDFIIDSAEKDAIKTANYLSSVLLKKTDIVSRDLITTDFVKKNQLVKNTLKIEKIKVFSQSGETVYSTDPQDIGEIHRHNYFIDIVSQGKTYTKFVQKGKPTLEGRTFISDVVETYVPIMTNGRFIGAFEIYNDITDKKEVLDNLVTRSLIILLIIVTILLTVSIVVMIKASFVMIKNRQAEDRIFDNNEFLKNVINSISHPFYVVDANTYEIKLANKASGFKPGKLENSTCYGFTRNRSKPCSGENHICPVIEVKRTQKPVLVEHLHKNSEGVERLFEISAFPLFDDENKVTAVIESSIDITEQKQVEEALKESEEFSSGLLEGSPNSMIVFNQDTSIKYVNPMFEVLSGFTSAEVLGKKAPFPWWIDDPEFGTIDQRLKGIRDGGSKLERLFRKKDGKQFWVEINSIPRLSNLKYGYTFSIWNDITERKQVEENLRKSEQKFKDFIMSAEEGFVLYDSELNLVDINDKALEIFPPGSSKENFSGKHIVEVAPYLKGIERYEEYVDVKNTGKPLHFEDFMPDAVYGDRHLSLKVFKFGEGLGFIFSDITDRKKGEEQIKINLKEKETLLQEIHHRVKNNMTVISSLLKLQMMSVADKKAKEALQDSQNRVQTMSMIHEILYRSDNLSSIDMQKYMSELGRIVLQSYNVGGKLNLKVKGENVMIGVKQASSLGLIINELIANSLKYAFPDDRKGEIVLKFKSNKENEAELTISDNGVGIPEGFDLQKADSFGLKLVKIIAENQLDGSIDMGNKNGTKFIIKFNIDEA